MSNGQKIFKHYAHKDKCNAATFIERSLDSYDPEAGSLETITANIANTTEAFARLVQILHDKKELTIEQVYYVADAAGCGDD